jgi:hypothetical protein
MAGHPRLHRNGLLLNAANCPLPVLDTTLLHVQAALNWACAGEEASYCQGTWHTG